MTVAAATENTFPKLLIRNARLFADRPAYRHKDLGIWRAWTRCGTSARYSPGWEICARS